MTAQSDHWRKPHMIKTPSLRYFIYIAALAYFVLTIANPAD